MLASVHAPRDCPAGCTLKLLAITLPCTKAPGACNWYFFLLVLLTMHMTHSRTLNQCLCIMCICMWMVCVCARARVCVLQKGAYWH